MSAVCAQCTVQFVTFAVDVIRRRRRCHPTATAHFAWLWFGIWLIGWRRVSARMREMKWDVKTKSKRVELTMQSEYYVHQPTTSVAHPYNSRGQFILSCPSGALSDCCALRSRRKKKKSNLKAISICKKAVSTLLVLSWKWKFTHKDGLRHVTSTEQKKREKRAAAFNM